MESKEALKSVVKSPARDAHLKVGKGFSLSEIEASGHSLEVIKKLNVKIDYFRKSSHVNNVNLLKSIKITASKDKKREPFIQKEKKRTPFKPKTKKKRKKPTPATKSEVKPKEKPKKEIKKKPTKTKPIETDNTPLIKLSGLGPTTSSKFNDIGVTCVEDLLKEKPEELALIIKGCSEEKIKKWIEEGKELI
ncbi:MAG: helix-hairpin-helix domain-containing protein [Promethearchaeota archaeon]